jgi:hypothetical protein
LGTNVISGDIATGELVGAIILSISKSPELVFS